MISQSTSPLGRNTYLYKAMKIKSLARSTHTRDDRGKNPKQNGIEQCRHTFRITATRCAPCSGYNAECRHYEKNDAADAKWFCDTIHSFIGRINNADCDADLPKMVQAVEISEAELEETMKNPPKLTEEKARNLSFLPAIMKEDDGCIAIIPMGEGVVRIKDEEAAKKLYGLILEMLRQNDCEKRAENAHQN